MEVYEFQEKLKQLVCLAQERDQDLGREDVLGVFGEGALSAPQLGSLYQYLRLKGIRINGRELACDAPFAVGTADSEGSARQGDEEEDYSGKLAALSPKEKEYHDEMLAQAAAWEPEKPGERANLLNGLRNGYPACERLVQIYQADILRQAVLSWREGIYLADLVQEGSMALLLAPFGEMPAVGADRWMIGQIRQAMEHYGSAQEEEKERDGILVDKVQSLEKAIRELSDDGEGTFGVEELSLFLDMSREEIEDILRLAGEGNGN